MTDDLTDEELDQSTPKIVPNGCISLGEPSMSMPKLGYCIHDKPPKQCVECALGYGG